MKRVLALLGLFSAISVSFVFARPVSKDFNTPFTDTSSFSAYHLDAGFTAMEDGERVGRIELWANGKCSIINYEDDFTVKGTYDIREEITIGGSTYIDFYIDGKTYTGKYIWPLQDKLSIIFDDLVFRLSRK